MVERIRNPKDLAALRERSVREQQLRAGARDVRVTVHMGTCGIAAGASDILVCLMEELASAGAENVTIHRSGCAGLCQQEPMMTVEDASGRSVCYGRLTADKVRQVVLEHIVGGQPVADFTVRT
ncbi:MAG: (2Fe-2S) ferredoxin domain-containing protein [Candidatus Brocadiaceae bacterium]|nr:(2Fe-2S) ferredoxin domain-containing protein [Candidatus Brocadiaceae bacterium]